MDKVVVVTGGSSGIGEGVVMGAAAAGATCVAVGRNRQRLDGAVNAVKRSGGVCHSIATDLTSEDGPGKVVTGALSAGGRIDVLVHSAGIFGPKPFLETTLDDLDNMWQINVRAPFAMTQAALPHMSAGGVVIFISSVDGHVGFANDSAYAASKAAIEGLTRALSLELAADGVRVGAVAPGFTKTPMNAPYRQDGGTLEAAAINETPAGRLATVEDIARSVVFLASDAADYMHGAILCVDGGYPASTLQKGMG